MSISLAMNGEHLFTSFYGCVAQGSRAHRTHSQEKPFQCTLSGCEKWFSRLDNVRQRASSFDSQLRRAQLIRSADVKTQHSHEMHSLETQDMMRSLAVVQKTISAEAAARRRERNAAYQASTLDVPRSANHHTPPEALPPLDRSRGSSSPDTSAAPSPEDLGHFAGRRLSQTQPTYPIVYSSPYQVLGGVKMSESPPGGLNYTSILPSYTSTPYGILPAMPEPRHRSLPSLAGVADWAPPPVPAPDARYARPVSPPEPPTAHDALAQHHLQSPAQLRPTAPALSPYAHYARAPGATYPIPTASAAAMPWMTAPADSDGSTGGTLDPYSRPLSVPPPTSNYGLPPVFNRRPSASSSLADYVLAPEPVEQGTAAEQAPARSAESGSLSAFGISHGLDGEVEVNDEEVVASPQSSPRSALLDRRAPRLLPVHDLGSANAFTWPDRTLGTTPLSSPNLNSGDAFPSPFIEQPSAFPAAPRSIYTGLAAALGRR
jgi:hypothetical protein